MKYILPTLINNRRIHFFDLKKNHTEPSEHFIADLPSISALVPLITIPKDKNLQTIEIGGKDLLISNMNFSQFYLDGMLRINLTPSIQSDKPLPSSEDNMIEEDWKLEEDESIDTPELPEWETKLQSIADIDGNRLMIVDTEKEWSLQLQVTDPLKLSAMLPKLEIQIVYDKVYTDAFTIFLAPRNQFFHMALDFGSEASQLSNKYYKNSLGVSTEVKAEEHLFLMIKNYMNERAENKEYLQYESNSNFLKSNFFIKNDLGEFNPSDPHVTYIPQPQTIELLTKKGELNTTLNEYSTLPNLKLAHKHASILTDFSFTYEVNGRQKTTTFEKIKELVYASILRKISQSYLYEQADKGIDIFLRFTLLIPNIYDIEDIQKTKNILQQILIDSQDDPEMPTIKGYEIQTLSESDASFLGYYNSGTNNTMPGHYYIIIDCGKGTTDFSILKTDQFNNKETTPIYRNGFAGAGNLISYAVFQSALEFMISNASNPTDAQNFFKSYLNKLPINDSYQFFEQIEKWKFNYDKSTPQSEIENAWIAVSNEDVNFTNFFSQNLGFQEFLRLIENTNQVYDWGNYIQQTVNNISDNVTQNILTVMSKMDPTTPCGGVLLTGRAFLFDPLYESMKQKLMDIGIPSVKIEELMEGDRLKNICMQGALLEGNIVNPEMVGYPIQIELQSNEIEEAKEDEHKNWITRISLWAKHLADGTLYDEMNNEFYVDGKNLANSKFIMGDSYYMISNSWFYNKDNFDAIDFIFTKEGYYFRAKKADGTILQISSLGNPDPTTAVNSRYVISSMFPAKINTDLIYPLKKDFSALNFSDLLPS